MKTHGKSLAKWLGRCMDLVGIDLADALAHARNAVTHTLLETPDGRPTLRKAVNSRSFVSAVGHLSHIKSVLVGPSSQALDGLLRDARDEFYREAWKEWMGVLPEELTVSREKAPSVAQINEIRGYPIHNVDISDEIGDVIKRIDRALRVAVTSAGQSTNTDRYIEIKLTTWRSQAESTLLKKLTTALSDGQMCAQQMAAHEVIHPDYRSEISWEL